MAKKVRFIPARAGNTLSGRSTTASPYGSSPRVRGTLGFTLPAVNLLRFIPARAGNTVMATSCNLALAVHPRACGEHVTSCPRLSLSSGSSPRVRGTLTVSASCSAFSRFIPARAGNTSRIKAISKTSSGSSPRVRGTLEKASPKTIIRRFIPARAGNTSVGGGVRHVAAVHPRACGEHLLIPDPCISISGSSPRVRGTHTTWTVSYALNSVHPRACGEHLSTPCPSA